MKGGIESKLKLFEAWAKVQDEDRYPLRLTYKQFGHMLIWHTSNPEGGITSEWRLGKGKCYEVECWVEWAPLRVATIATFHPNFRPFVKTFARYQPQHLLFHFHLLQWHCIQYICNTWALLGKTILAWILSEKVKQTLTFTTHAYFLLLLNLSLVTSHLLQMPCINAFVLQ